MTANYKLLAVAALGALAFAVQTQVETVVIASGAELGDPGRFGRAERHQGRDCALPGQGVCIGVCLECRSTSPKPCTSK